MPNHDQLYEKATKAITDLFSDQSVSQEKTARSLKALREEINLYLEILDPD